MKASAWYRRSESTICLQHAQLDINGGDWSSYHVCFDCPDFRCLPASLCWNGLPNPVSKDGKHSDEAISTAQVILGVNGAIFDNLS